MNTTLRRRHARLWFLIGPLLVAGVIGAILLRPPSLDSVAASNSASTAVQQQVPAGEKP